VAGFVTPGSFVDVVASVKSANSETFSRIVLERVKVLAIEQDITGDPAKPKVASAVTLELKPDEVEKLDLARSIGNLSLALRNEFDDLKVKSEGVRMRDIMGDFSVVSGLSPAAVQLDSPASGSKGARNPKMEEIRGVLNGPLQ
jgi:pilus assembly protein CpaB